MTAVRPVYTLDTFPWDRLKFHKSLASIPSSARQSGTGKAAKRRTAELVLAVPGLLEYMLELEESPDTPNKFRRFMAVRSTKGDGTDSLGLHWEPKLVGLGWRQLAWEDEPAVEEHRRRLVALRPDTTGMVAETKQEGDNYGKVSLRLVAGRCDTPKYRNQCTLTPQQVLKEALVMLAPDEEGVGVVASFLAHEGRTFNTGKRIEWQIDLVTLKFLEGDGGDRIGYHSDAEDMVKAFFLRSHTREPDEVFGAFKVFGPRRQVPNYNWSDRKRMAGNLPLAWWQVMREGTGYNQRDERGEWRPGITIDNSVLVPYHSDVTAPLVGTDHLKVDKKKGVYGSTRVAAFIDWCEENGLEVNWRKPNSGRSNRSASHNEPGRLVVKPSMG